MASKRIAIFDALKFFAIFLVVYGHCIQYFQSEIYYNQPIYRIIYSFHMPLFMTLVGFFATSLHTLSYSEILKKKFIQLVLPSITTGVIIWLFFIREFSAEIFKGMIANNLWFLKSAFICCLIYSVSFKLNKFKTPYIIITIILSQAFPIYQLYLMYPCFLYGVLLKSYYTQYQKHDKSIAIISGLLFGILLLHWDASNWYHGNSIPLITKLYNRFYRIIIGITGTTFFVTLFEVFKLKIVNSKIGRLMCNYGRYTLGIYILQTILLEIILSSYICLDNYTFLTYNFIICPVIALIIILLSLSFIRIMSLNKLLSLLLLGKYPN